MFDNGYYNPYQQQQRMPQFVVRQVSNVEEAKACLIDPVNVWLFVDMQAGRIYMKRMGSNGLSVFNVFSCSDGEAVSGGADPLKALSDRVTALENALGVKAEETHG